MAAVTAGITRQQQQHHHQQQQRPASGPMPAAPTFDPLRDGDRTLASFRALRPAATDADDLPPCWELEGAAPAAKRPLAPMARVLEGKAELWVLQLPARLDLAALDGASLRVDEAALRRQAPAAAGAGDAAIGSLELPADAAESLGLVRRYALRQEAGAAADNGGLFVVAPTERAGGALEALRCARRVVVAGDVSAANAALVAATHAAEPELQFYPEAMPPARANALLQERRRFEPPPAQPAPGTWPPAGWEPGPALAERDRRRAQRRKRGLPEVDPRDDLERQPLADLRPSDGAPWGVAGGRPLPPQWQALPGDARAGRGGAPLGDVEHDVSIAYAYGDA